MIELLYSSHNSFWRHVGQNSHGGTPGNLGWQRMSDGKIQLRKAARYVLIHLLWASGAIGWARKRLQKENAVVVLMLHRVLSDQQKAETNSEAAMIVGDRVYRDLVQYLRRHYRIVDVTNDNLEAQGEQLAVALTFDDGWQDNMAPLTRDRVDHGVPATIFVSPGLTGLNNPFWPEQVRAILGDRPERELKQVVESLKKLDPSDRSAQVNILARQNGVIQARSSETTDRTLTWGELSQLRAAGITLGTHSQNHEILTSLPSLELIDGELRESKRDLEEHCADECSAVAYPNGGHNDQVVERTRAAGYRRAFTTTPGVWTKETDPLRIPRMNISDSRIALGGRFSPAAFEYSVMWRAYQFWRKAACGKSQVVSSQRHAVAERVPVASQDH